MRHYNIPIFVPHKGCPHDCAFCNQKKITGKTVVPTGEDVKRAIETALDSFKEEDRFSEVAFFGGSFTAIEANLQEELLSAAYPYIKSGDIDGIRCSTRPDAISDEILKRLVHFGVTTVELGVQSTDEEVLARSLRGHTAADVRKAAKLIHEYGIDLGVQVMTGLPGDTVEKDIETVKELIALSPVCARIYPVLVLVDTELYKMYREGQYVAQTIDEAVDICAILYEMFIKANVHVIRMGLMASNEIREMSQSVVAGPCHSSFGELVKSRVLLGKLRRDAIKKEDKMVVYVHPKELSMAIGNCKRNKETLEKEWGGAVLFVADAHRKLYLP